MTNQEYQKEITWLFSQIPNYQMDGAKAYKPGLENITKLCAFFGNPQEQLKTIHIGGTNGKGSTSNMVASVLQEAGYTIGLYNSPHLIDFSERIRINGKNCDQQFIYDFIQKLKTLPAEITPSFFEFTTIMAFEYFKQKKVDFAIIEVGLGGRLDATNIIFPMVSAITNIALDHQDILGNTLEKIAAEKAGIIKQGIPIVSGEENEVIRQIFKAKAVELKSEFMDATQLHHSYGSDLKGSYQTKNIKVALGILQQLQNMEVKISLHDIRKGLLNVQKNTHFIGRWYEFSAHPLVICDTAHNQAGLKEVFAQLNTLQKHKHIILGFVNDKKIDEVLQILPSDSIYYFVKPNNNRGRDPRDYEDLLKKSKINYKIFDGVNDAYLSAKQAVENDEMIFIGGSNFIIGEFLEKNLEK